MSDPTLAPLLVMSEAELQLIGTLRTMPHFTSRDRADLVKELDAQRQRVASLTAEARERTLQLDRLGVAFDKQVELTASLTAENARLREELRQTRECPMILCPFEEENARLRAELSALKGH